MGGALFNGRPKRNVRATKIMKINRRLVKDSAAGLETPFTKVVGETSCAEKQMQPTSWSSA